MMLAWQQDAGVALAADPGRNAVRAWRSQPRRHGARRGHRGHADRQRPGGRPRLGRRALPRAPAGGGPGRRRRARNRDRSAGPGRARDRQALQRPSCPAGTAIRFPSASPTATGCRCSWTTTSTLWPRGALDELGRRRPPALHQGRDRDRLRDRRRQAHPPGRRGRAGDIGHIRVAAGDEDAIVCGCGNVGCLEALAGGGAMAARLRDQGLDAADSRAVVELARAEPAAVRLVRESGR